MNLNLTSTIQMPDHRLRRDVVALCQKLQKPVLKLLAKDYRDNGLQHWCDEYGSAALVNIAVFNELQHTITGWPGGKPGADDSNRPERALPFPKRVIVFSPHPDDDVISMGGTIRRLIQQGNDVHVAYETSGNIAVGDEDLTRYLLFLEGFNDSFDAGRDQVISDKCRSISEYLQAKGDGDPDTRDILRLKGLIRRGEARTACAYNHIAPDHVHFLDLPFYESGRIEKLPVSAADVEIVRQLIASVRPHQIYVAADLADPHGTHRKCTDVVLAAVDEERMAAAQWLSDCRIWMYRGAWAEWDVADIDMCVPMSPEELLEKRNAILRHQSQMESAPFMGDDSRLFWQRAEDRNRATAERYDALGLACYEAMEAFVEYHFPAVVSYF
ncbi:MAG: PIG-L family deacetylase [Prevotella sp.]|nr:PIG-L family deacetylase [Prevotella sp.]